MVSYNLTHELPDPPASDRIFGDEVAYTRGRNLTSGRPVKTLVRGLGVLSMRQHEWDTLHVVWLYLQHVAWFLGFGVVHDHVGQRGKGSSLNSKKQIKPLLGTRDGGRANDFLFWPVSEVRKPAFLWILLEILCPKNKSPLSPFQLNPGGFYPLATEESSVIHSGSC